MYIHRLQSSLLSVQVRQTATVLWQVVDDKIRLAVFVRNVCHYRLHDPTILHRRIDNRLVLPSRRYVIISLFALSRGVGG